ncbi:MAG: hypothetical protein LBH80_05940 [Prevotellaceae bacterium]|jgi:hypothetical protein|nr:hypothetical protein [Prevotellaceae bacterium]
MKKIKDLLFILAPLFLFFSCGSDSADNPVFGESDVPRIYIDWQKDMVFSTGDTIRLYPEISPADGATYIWTLGDKVISTEKTLEYEITEFGEFVLRFEVARNGVKNHRMANLVIAKPFVPKTYTKRSVAFLSINGSVSDIQWDEVTHVILTSSVVQQSGAPNFEFENGPNISALITTAHNNGIYVLMDFSGALGSYVSGATVYGSYDFYNAAISPTVRQDLINEMLRFVNTNGFDGINIYMDKASETGVFDNPAALREFYEELAAQAPETTDRGDFLLTMSMVAGGTRSALDEVVTVPEYDWINILAFGGEDLIPGPHASFWMFTDNIDYWTGKGIGKEKINPVAPAFGLRYFGDISEYTWGNLWQFTEYRGYRAICDEYPNAHETNNINVDNGLFYDGLNEVKAKAEYIVSQDYGGMGLWSVENDSKDAAKSLMKQINASLGN